MKKGQAAMEFLMTYGWAILVVLIAIGALAYFGILNPGRFLPNSCTLFPGLACTEFKVTGSGYTPVAYANQVQVFMRNGIGDSMIISAATLPNSACTAPTVTRPGGSLPYTLGDGTLGWLNFTCGAGQTGVKGDRFKSDISLSYTVGTTGLSHNRQGAMVAQVE